MRLGNVNTHRSAWKCIKGYVCFMEFRHEKLRGILTYHPLKSTRKAWNERSKSRDFFEIKKSHGTCPGFYPTRKQELHRVEQSGGQKNGFLNEPLRVLLTEYLLTVYRIWLNIVPIMMQSCIMIVYHVYHDNILKISLLLNNITGNCSIWRTNNLKVMMLTILFF